MLQGFEIDRVQGLRHDLAQLTAVVGSGEEVDDNLFGPDLEHPGRLGQLTKVIVIVPVIVVGLF